jgi:hypothetical protein
MRSRSTLSLRLVPLVGASAWCLVVNFGQEFFLLPKPSFSFTKSRGCLQKAPRFSALLMIQDFYVET